MNDLLNEYLLSEVSNITHDFVRQLVSKVKKQDICTYVGHFICDHMLTNNIWILQKIKEYFEVIEGCKPAEKERVIKVYYALFHAIGNSDKGNYTFHYTNEKSALFINDIKDLRFSSGTSDKNDLSQLQPVLSEECYSLLTIMYDCFLYSVESKANIQKCFLIMRYLLTLSPRHYIQGTTKGVSMDIIDFVFLICVWYSNTPQCTEELKSYITVAKDIFYYKLKKKDKLLRINILFYMIYVIINKKVRNQEIDFDGVNVQLTKTANKQDHFISSEQGDGSHEIRESRESKGKKAIEKHKDPYVEDKCQYLFIYMEYDQQTMYEIEREREKSRIMAKLMRTSTKEIEVDSLLMKDYRNEVLITKLSR
jgi:hypothetical protein